MNNNTYVSSGSTVAHCRYGFRSDKLRVQYM
jgi:hypothetical protein